MRLVPITAEDEDLTVRLECDPLMMLHIGGPRPEADVRASHKRRLALMEQGSARMYKIVGEDSEVLGTIGIWKIDERPQAYEMGWFVLPEHQRKGVATEAARLVISQACSDPQVACVYAFPPVTNAASNGVAKNAGMENQDEFDNEGFFGVLRCNNWRIALKPECELE